MSRELALGSIYTCTFSPDAPSVVAVGGSENGQ
jgi:hypothetical protein